MKIIIWAFCKFCYIRTEQEYTHDEGRNEYYKCVKCGNEHSYTVR